MEVRPAVRIGELDDGGHAQKAERGPAGEEAEREQDRQHDFRCARHRRDEFRHGERDLGAEDVQLVVLRKQDLRSERQREPAVPAREPRGEEGSRQREPQDEQREPRRNEPKDDAGEASDRVRRGERRRVCGVGDHDARPGMMEATAPESTNPTRWAPKSKAGSFERGDGFDQCRALAQAAERNRSRAAAGRARGHRNRDA